MRKAASAVCHEHTDRARGVWSCTCQRRSKDASARRSKDTSRMMAGRRPAGRLPASRSFVGWDVRYAGRSGRTLAALALLEPIAVAVHFEDVDVVREPVEQRAGIPAAPRM